MTNPRVVSKSNAGAVKKDEPQASINEAGEENPKSLLEIGRFGRLLLLLLLILVFVPVPVLLLILGLPSLSSGSRSRVLASPG